VDIVDIDASRNARPRPGAAEGVTVLYEAHAVGLIRLGFVMLGDRGRAEDVVQDAFIGLYRNWDRLDDQGNALTYVRSSVINGCRAALRTQIRGERRDRAAAARDGRPPFDSTEAAVLLSEEHQEVVAAVRKLAHRQREALMLRYYLGLSTDETARVMGVSTGTVKSAISRAISAVARALKEEL
jgi:RNA polymerase sigma-70 factor (sigma-E family)